MTEFVGFEFNLRLRLSLTVIQCTGLIAFFGGTSCMKEIMYENIAELFGRGSGPAYISLPDYRCFVWSMRHHDELISRTSWHSMNVFP